MTPTPPPQSLFQRVQLLLAEGMGVGRVPKAPGTWGSVLGLLWTAALLWPRSAWLFLLGCGVGIVLSVWLCGVGERLLGKEDPGSVVLDEITAVPLCFAPWLLFQSCHGHVPGVQEWLGVWHGGFAVSGFLLFRLFDIWKPGPIGWVQRWHGGLGITADDVLAGLAAGILLLCAQH